MGVGRGLIHSGEESRSTRRACGIRGKDSRIAHTLLGKPVEIWRVHMRCAVAAQVMAQILSDEPQDVRLRTRERSSIGSQQARVFEYQWQQSNRNLVQGGHKSLGLPVDAATCSLVHNS